jgi:Cu(I)/Ag(I) efflux system protein CusF
MKQLKTMISCAVLLGAAALASPAMAHEGHQHAQHGAASAPADAAPMSEGEVKKVDKSAGKVTIKHGPLQNLGMPAMTMVFKAKDPAMLETLKPGDKINFVAEKVNGSLTLTRWEAAK